MLNNVILELVEERGLSQSDLHEIVTEGILAAYEKKYPDVPFRVSIDQAENNIVIEIQKDVVTTPEDDLLQISVRKARFFKKAIEAGQKLWVPFEGGIGRVEIAKAKQVIAGKIRDVEAREVYDQFKDRQGEIVVGTVNKVEKNGVVVSLREVSALLPRSGFIPGERYTPGRPVRALLKEVHTDYRGDAQLILDRASVGFLLKILEVEIPEVYDRLIEIKAAARRAGYKSKIIISSNDPNIDPVGTCVGVGGARIKPILREFGGEKIDIISWANSKEELVKSALRPAEVNQVEILDDGSAKAWISDDQRAYAIGKMGQNIALASELLGMDIDLVASGSSVSDEKSEHENIDTE